MPKGLTPAEMAMHALNAAADNLKGGLDKLPARASAQEHLAAAEIQIELAKAASLLEIGRQLQHLSSIATPGESIRYGMAQVADALRDGGRPSE